MLFGLFKSKVGDKANDKQEDSVVCKLSGGNQTCDLIEQLRLKQEELHNIKKRQKKLENRHPELLNSLIKILLAAEHTDFPRLTYIYCDSRSYKTYSDGVNRFFSMYDGTSVIEQILLKVSTSDIDSMCTELKSLRERGQLVQQCDNERRSVEEEISSIKKKLGIE